MSESSSESEISIGYITKSFGDLNNKLENIYCSQFNFLVAPLIAPNSKEFKPISDVVLETQDWSQRIIVLLDENDLNSTQRLDFMSRLIDHASYCLANAVYIRCPQLKSSIHSLGRLISQKLLTEFPMNFYIEVPACLEQPDQPTDAAEELIADPWSAWNELRTLIPANNRVQVSLELTPDLPSEEEQKRWTGEPIFVVKVPSGTFQADKNGSPVLSLPHQMFLAKLVKSRDITLVYDGPETGGHSLKSVSLYFKSILWPTIAPVNGCDFLWKETQDRLQSPLQPLRDNLPSSSYEVFESDSVKYEFYYRALYEAIYTKIREQTLGPEFTGAQSDGPEMNVAKVTPSPQPTSGQKAKKGKSKSIGQTGGKSLALIHPSQEPAESNDWKPKPVDLEKAKQVKLIIIVAGAGRGPLVTAALKAAQNAKLADVTIHIVEKNPNAIITLSSKMDSVWPIKFPNFGKLFLHETDMRSFCPPEKADILVSELLGSFSDNELSPECLDGVFDAVKGNAICIPQSYTSHLHPIMSPKLFASLQTVADATKISQEAVLQSHFVVNIRNFYSPCDTKEVFTFSHLQPSINRTSENNYHNRVSIELTFDNELDYVCHGFAGYFTTKLFGPICLSTRPADHTRGLNSWFPVYFPLLKPFLVPAKQGLTMKMYRETNGRIVWYELLVTKPLLSQIQNSAGKCHSIGLQ